MLADRWRIVPGTTRGSILLSLALLLTRSRDQAKGLASLLQQSLHPLVTAHHLVSAPAANLTKCLQARMR
eukprot:1140406-Pelagomonas_calceolata.AAC.1